MEYRIENVADHVEVYDGQGKFCFSCDTKREAYNELKYYNR